MRCVGEAGSEGNGDLFDVDPDVLRFLERTAGLCLISVRSISIFIGWAIDEGGLLIYITSEL